MRLATDCFLGWRYLYRRRSSRTVTVGTLVLLGWVVLQVGAYFLLPQATLGPVLAVLTVVSVLAFVAFGLLNFFSAFTSVSVIGVVLGVAALTVMLSVTSGFEEVFRARVLGVNAHALVLKYGLDFSEYRDVMKKAEAMKPDVVAVAPFVFNQMMIARGSQRSGVLIKGIDIERSPKVLDVGERLTSGKVPDLAVMAPATDGDPQVALPGIFLGKELQKKLRVKLGETVRVVAPKVDLDPSNWKSQGGSPSAREFRVAGIFYSGFDEYDRRLAYVNLPEAQAFFPAGDVVTGIEMRVADVENAQTIAERLHKTLGGAPYRTLDWEELNHNLFTALRTQKLMLVVVLTLIILVAAFNVIATLTMLVVKKTKEIAILKSMGMRSGGVARVFQVAGLTIGIVGTAAGLAVGLLICAIVARFGYALDPRVYLIDRLPVRVIPLEMLLTTGITMTICLVATIYPSLKAAHLPPVEGLRRE